ncbi:HAMP domain-containing histidine kinase [Candidatus Gracilibacteria bacterium 28_42_T64]|nr:HAMP domain-containing histidine kinase [Candidatus Gracilibacteria bacterium 28_42_T64]
MFTILVFFACLILGLVFLGAKYLHENKIEKDNFAFSTNTIQKRFINLKEFISVHEIGNSLFTRDKNSGIVRKKPKIEDKLINFLIIDSAGDIIYQNIRDNIEGKVLESVLQKLVYNRVYRIDDYYLKISDLIDQKEKYTIIFIKKLRYDKDDYIYDFIRFLLILSIFTIILYFIGYKFVQKNLEPVEETLLDMQDFIHNAGHELKTPISVIHGNLQLLKEIKKYDKDLLIEGIKEIERLDKLIEGLIDLSNINKEDNLEKLYVQKEIQDIVSDFDVKIKDKDLRLVTKLESKIVIHANREYLYIVISNLLSNAIKYSNKGGKITVVLDKNRLIMKDLGIGIQKENFEKIFMRFFREEGIRSSDSFGIGLSLVRKIVRIYNWKIEVQSKVGKGTKFIITF